MTRWGVVTDVTAWYQWDGVDQWVVSTGDAEGGEIACVGGYDSEDEAWAAALEEADRHGVRAELHRAGTTEVVRSYVPEAAEVAS